MALLTLKERLLSLLAKELELCIPQFEPHTLDYQMVIYASRDFETWMKTEWNLESNDKVYEKLDLYLKEDYDGFRFLLRFWVNQWFEKWRERVKIFATKPKMPPQYLDRIKKARRLYHEMENGKELKMMIIRKLVRQGETCMSEVIAQNLILEEIVKRIQTTDANPKNVMLDPMDILNDLSYTISRLPKERGPLIYLDIKTYIL
jgi:hypothetical protein